MYSSNTDREQMLQQLTKLKETVGFSPVSGPLKHTKIKDLVLLQTQITFYLQRDWNMLKALLQLRQNNCSCLKEMFN